MSNPKRVLFACELGASLPALDRLLPIAAGMTAQGHTVSLVLRDPSLVADLAASQSWSLTVAPAWRAAPPPGFLAVSYADVLLQCGYATPETLRDLLAGWRQVFALGQPDLLIADFAPTALLAARAVGLPAVVLGNGYTLPPATDPLPSLRPWEEIDPTRIAESEARVLAIVNPTLGAIGGAPLTCLADLFQQTATQILCAFPELDHYPGRGDAAWFGEVFDAGTGQPPHWPTGSAERIYARMDGRHPAFAGLIQALDRLGLPSIVEATRISDELARVLCRPHVHVGIAPTDRAAALASCDFVVCQDIATVAPALLATRPVLMMPWPVEQTMTLYRVAPQGLGHGVPPSATADDMEAALRRLLDDAACRQRAAAFARLYDGYTPEMAIEPALAECLDLLA